LLDGIGDPSPRRRTVVIVFGLKVAGARGAFPGALTPKRLSIRSAARQMSISGITGRNSECGDPEKISQCWRRAGGGVLPS
jgi:hypothetical protein